MAGLARYLTGDHRRLEALLDAATAEAGRIDAELFEQFRAGLLRHIGIEEKILLPAARRARGGTPLPDARQLRLDHGAIAAMLVPTPTPAGVTQLRTMLALHDAVEEGPHGVYEQCDELLRTGSAALLEQIRNFPAVRTAPHTDGPLVARHIADCLALAGRRLP